MSVTGSGAIPLGVRTAATGLVCPAGAGAVSLRMSIEGIGYVCPAGRGAVDLHIVPEGIGVSTPAGTGTLSIGASITGTGAPLSSGAGAVSLGVTVAGVGSPINTGSGAVSAGVIVAGTDAGIGAVSVGVTIAATGWVGTAAAGRWLYLHTVPPAQIYSVEALRGRLSPALPAHRLDWAASDTRSEIGRTNDSWSARLIGANPDLRNRLTMQAPYGVRVDMYDGGTLIRTGVSTGVSYAERDTTIDVQSDIWTRDLPIRTSADLGTFRDVEPLPRR